MEPLKEITILAGLFIFMWFGWGVALTYPLRLPVKLLHEAGHALAVRLTGGRVGEIQIHNEFGGLTTHEGGNEHVIRHGGFVSSLLLGMALVCSSYLPLAERVLVLLGLTVMLIALLWVMNSLTLCLSIVMAAVMIAAGFLLKGPAEAMIVRFIGLCCMLYSVMEVGHLRRMFVHIKDELTDTQHLMSIARVHAVPWSIAWSALSICVLALFAARMIIKA